MALKDVAGIFSRAFVVGYFVPAFAALVILQVTVTHGALPKAYNGLTEGTQLLVVGGVAVMLGLLLWGVHYPVLRLFQGYALEGLSEWTYPRVHLRGRAVGGWRLQPCAWVYVRARARWLTRYGHLVGVAGSDLRSPERTQALKELNKQWPGTERQVLITRLGNVIASFEGHPRTRYNLNGIYAYPRIATMLGEAEREIITDARTDLAFFLNLALLAVLTGTYILVDSVWHGWLLTPAGLAALLVPPLVYMGARTAAVDAAHRWGAAVRSAFDLHRLEFYKQMGLRRPRTQAEEETTANAVNRLLVYGETLPDQLRQEEDEGNGT
jgi:hypothetical protein